MLSHPRIGILGSLIKGLPDLWPRLNDETVFGHFFDLSKNILKYHYRHLRFDALVFENKNGVVMLNAILEAETDRADFHEIECTGNKIYIYQVLIFWHRCASFI